jgi:hypothetical protein
MREPRTACRISALRSEFAPVREERREFVFEARDLALADAAGNCGNCARRGACFELIARTRRELER